MTRVDASPRRALIRAGYEPTLSAFGQPETRPTEPQCNALEAIHDTQ